LAGAVFVRCADGASHISLVHLSSRIVPLYFNCPWR
jgi:hypothetical protein